MKSIRSKSSSRGRVILASAVLAVLAFGCGKHSEDQQASASGNATQAVAAEHTGPLTGSQGTSQGEAVEREETGEVLSADSLPPEIAVSAPDTLVTPGSVVEITASASPDVVELTLSDGIHKPQLFTYDSPESGAGVWKTFYRIPMKIRGERVGLSVTAKNGVNRWRRVWVFMDVQKAEGQKALEQQGTEQK